MARPMYNFRVTGHKELERALERVSSKMQDQIVRRAVTAAAKPILAQAKRNVPRRYGALMRALDVKTIRSRRLAASRRVGIMAMIGPRSDVQFIISEPGKREPRKVRPVRYAHLVEFGASRGSEERTGGSRFLTRAMDSQSAAASAILQERIRQGLMQAIAEGNR